MERHLQEVRLAPLSPDRLAAVLDPEARERFEAALEQAARMLEGRIIWNVNSTAAGGGVAEILRSFLSYARGSGVNVRWTVISGPPEFFRLTKRIHNFLHGEPGDGGPLGEEEAALYREVTAENAEELAETVRPDDIVVLHDPQTAGLTNRLHETKATVIWRSHVGAEERNALVDRAWEFLAPFVEAADACVFSRRAYVPPWASNVRTEIIQPSIDPFSPKNQELAPEAVQAILSHVGLVVAPTTDGATPSYTRQDGTPGRVDRMCELLSTGPPPSFDAPLVVQVSRWDRLKDPIGVMMGFADRTQDSSDSHLVLAGPTVHSVADDPEGAEVLDEVEEAWRKLPHVRRSRVHLACLPMVDIEENAAIVNALQRHAEIAVQKSIKEGFGLTVSEAMWKSTPVVASAVGGIQDQIEDGVSGMLLPDPRDLAAFGEIISTLESDSELARTLGRNGHERVRAHFLVDRHALQYLDLLRSILD